MLDVAVRAGQTGISRRVGPGSLVAVVLLTKPRPGARWKISAIQTNAPSRSTSSCRISALAGRAGSGNAPCVRQSRWPG